MSPGKRAGLMSISWDSASLAVGPWTTLPSQTGVSYQPPALNQSTYYRRAVMDNNCLAVKYTYVVEVFVNTSPPVNGGAITGSGCVFPGNRPSPIIGSIPTGGTSPYTFVWERRSSATSAWIMITGATNRNYSSPALTQTTQFRRKTIDAFGEFAYSNIFTIEYHTAALGAGSIKATSSMSVCSGTTPGLIKSLSGISGFGENPSYQWQMKFAGGTYTDITGATGTTYQKPLSGNK